MEYVTIETNKRISCGSEGNNVSIKRIALHIADEHLEPRRNSRNRYISGDEDLLLFAKEKSTVLAEYYLISHVYGVTESSDILLITNFTTSVLLKFRWIFFLRIKFMSLICNTT